MESNITERDRALKILEEQIFTISSTYRESYLAHGKGALIVYTDLLDNNLAWSSINYRNKKECLEFFDNMKSRKKLGRLIYICYLMQTM
ncbi:MAG TPA: hypothetical protein VJL89_03320 [Thermodesulfovibrionia bacterium]|nr:hypothetical protein [Thermodesulfovibrionia bacterium]